MSNIVAKILGKIGVKYQIGLIGAATLVGFIAVGAIYYVGEQKQEAMQAVEVRENRGAELVKNIQIAFLKAREQEKDFLLTLDPKRAEKHSEIVAQTLPLFDELKKIHGASAGTEDANMTAKDVARVVATREGFLAYAKQFNDLVEIWRRGGLTPDSGLRGKLREAVHEIEGAIKGFDQPRLMATLLMMRRHEKDFLLRKDPKYLKKMDARLAEFGRELAASSIPEDAKVDIAAKAKTYRAAFGELADLILEELGNRDRMSGLYAEVMPKLMMLENQGIADARATVEALKRNTERTVVTMATTIIGATVLTLALALVIGLGISGPIGAMTAVMTRLAEGDKSAEIPAADQSNEIGEMARAVQVFKENAIRMDQMAKEQEEIERRAEEEKRRTMKDLADDFEARVKGVVETVTAAATEMQSAAQSLSSTAEETNHQADAVAAASEQASTNVQTVAAASEELSSSIAEIGRQVAQAASTSQQAKTEAERTNAQVQGLAEAAQKISDIVDLINDIASQTNLLALNASIEAARAGDAGKGFAVVASEVKNLATQTAKATEEISGQIGAVQSATEEAVKVIQGIVGTVGDISEISTAIASAVDEQDAATGEISRNVQEAALGTQEVSSNIGGVTQAASETGAAASQMLDAAGQLSREAETLRGEVDKFLTQIRAA